MELISVIITTADLFAVTIGHCVRVHWGAVPCCPHAYCCDWPVPYTGCHRRNGPNLGGCSLC